jgi:hypothetical protein
MDTLDLSELWEAQIGGRIELLTLDQLDAAFESGRISETTLVRAKGTDVWSTLATVLAATSAVDAQQLRTGRCRCPCTL